MDWKLWIHEQDRLIKKAQGSLAKKNFRKIILSQIPDSERFDVLDIARRLQMPFLIIKNLYPDIRVFPITFDEVNPQYAALYANSLAKIGAFNEAWILFEKINSRIETQPLVYLHMGMALVGQWNYLEARRHFVKYLQAPTVTGYQRLIGQINFISCLIALGELEQAKDLLKVFDGLEQTYPLLFLNSRELLLQIYSGEKKFNKAIELCKILRSNLNFVKSDFYFQLIRKWELINESYLNGQLSADWFKFQNSVREEQQFEIVRDMDFFRAIIEKDEKLMTRLYLGTPYDGYRKRITDAFQFARNKNFEYLVEFGERKRKNKVIIDTNEQLIQTRSYSKKIPHLPGQLIRCLTKDLYRPIYLGDLFGSIYQGEYFNPFSSPKRLEKLIQRAQRYFTENQVKIKIRSKDKNYWLSVNNEVQIFISDKPILSEFTEIEKWISQNKIKKFARKNLQKVTQSSKANVNRLIAKLIASGRLKRIGKGRATLYLIIS